MVRRIANVDNLLDIQEQADRMADAVSDYLAQGGSARRERMQQEEANYRRVRSRTDPNETGGRGENDR